MKYKRRKTNLTKYSSCKTEVEKEKILKFRKFKRRFAFVFTLSSMLFMLINSSNAGYKIRDFISSVSSNESDIFITTRDYLTENLQKLGKSGKEFRDDYLRAPNKQNAFAKNASSAIYPESPQTKPDKSQTAAKPVAASESVASQKPDAFAPESPISGIITSPYGERVHPVSGEISFHNGIDIAANEGDEIKAISGGVVETASYNEFSGNFVIIRHTDSITSSYAHMSKLNISGGDKVEKGDIIGFAGSTGTATGPHLHMEIRINKEPVNPVEYFDQG